jgi:hypothetical protein
LSETEAGKAAHPLDLYAIAAFAARQGIPDALAAAEAYASLSPRSRENWRSVADAVLMVRDASQDEKLSTALGELGASLRDQVAENARLERELAGDRAAVRALGEVLFGPVISDELARDDGGDATTEALRDMRDVLAGWGSGAQEAMPVGREALAALAEKWKGCAREDFKGALEYGGSTAHGLRGAGQAEADCARQLLEAIGMPAGDLPGPKSMDEAAVMPGVVVVLSAPQCAIVRDGGEVVTVIGLTAAGLRQYESVEEYEAENPGVPALAKERDRLARGAATLGDVVSRLGRLMYAAWIDAERGDHEAARETVTQAIEDVHELHTWDGTETGAEWLERTAGAGDGAEAAAIPAPPETAEARDGA